MIKMNNLLQNVNVYARIRVIIDSGIYVCFICVKSDGDCGWKGDRCMERKTEAWIGLDVGTTGVRAIAYEADGTRICGREAFYPLLTPAADRAEQDPQVIYGAVEQVVREAFNQRRKTLRNTMKGLLDSAAIEAAGVDGSLRPEQLDLAAFVRLADQLADQQQG